MAKTISQRAANGGKMFGTADAQTSTAPDHHSRAREAHAMTATRKSTASEPDDKGNPVATDRGTWPDGVHRAFVDGVRWWEFQNSGSTLFSDERNKAEAEAVRRYGPVSTSKLTDADVIAAIRKKHLRCNVRDYSPVRIRWRAATVDPGGSDVFGPGPYLLVPVRSPGRDEIRIRVYAPERLRRRLARDWKPKAVQP